jgi:hypothetical protein
MLKLRIADADWVHPASPEGAGSEVEVWRDSDGTVCAYGYTASGQHWMQFPGLASFCFDNHTDVVTAVGQKPLRLDWIRDAYCRSVLPLALQVRGREVLHASAILARQGVVALCGVSETGKSTIAYALSQRGYPLWADDAVAFDTWGRDVTALPLPFRIRLRTAAASFFAQEVAAANTSSVCSGQEQKVVEQEPGPLSMVCVLKRVPAKEDEPTIEAVRLKPALALAALLTHAYCFSLRNTERKRSMMQHYLDLTARVPAYEVCFPAGLERLPKILDSIEQAVSSLPTRPVGNSDFSRSLEALPISHGDSSAFERAWSPR